jgi:hypothetical protein
MYEAKPKFMVRIEYVLLTQCKYYVQSYLIQTIQQANCPHNIIILEKSQEVEGGWVG